MEMEATIKTHKNVARMTLYRGTTGTLRNTMWAANV